MALLGCVLGGCGWSETKFEVRGIEALCERAASCAGTFETAACIDELRATDRTSCDYDSRAARQCAVAAEDAACLTDPIFQTTTIEVPQPCLEVYDCEWIDLAPFEVRQPEG
jgi:hypothetical protein